MSGTMRVRFRVEYKGEKDDVDMPAPLSVEMDEGSTVIDLLRNAARFHQEFAYLTKHVGGVGDVVTSFNNVFNDDEPGFSWIFYSPHDQPLTKPLGSVRLTSGDEVVACYERRLEEREDQKIQLGEIKIAH